MKVKSASKLDVTKEIKSDMDILNTA